MADASVCGDGKRRGDSARADTDTAELAEEMKNRANDYFKGTCMDVRDFQLFDHHMQCLNSHIAGSTCTMSSVFLPLCKV